MASSAHPERREHPRHPVRAYAHVLQAQERCPVELVDMSFNGARLLSKHLDELSERTLNIGDEISLIVELEDIQIPNISDVLLHQARKILRLRGTLVYLKEHIIGVEYRPLSEVDQVLLTLLLSRPDD